MPSASFHEALTWSPWPPAPARESPTFLVSTARTSPTFAVLAGRAEPGSRVLVVAQDDYVAPLSVADHLATRGHQVTVVYATQTAAPLMARYSIGGILGRLSERGVVLRFMEEVIALGVNTVDVRNVYSLRTTTLEGFDSVVLACGSVSEASLYADLRHRRSEVHVLGDAYAPRRLVFATRQAYALARRLVVGS